MRILIGEVQSAMMLRLYTVGMISLFAIPDAAAAVEYGSLKNGERYERWFDKFVGQAASTIDGKLAWLMRNALIHEVSMNWRTNGYDFDRVIITLPSGSVSRIIGGLKIHWADKAAATLTVELVPLYTAILNGARRWLEEAELDSGKRAKIDSMMQVRPKGFAPYIGGMPVIT